MFVGNLICMPVPCIDSSLAIHNQQIQGLVTTWKYRHLPTSRAVFTKQVSLFDLMGAGRKGSTYSDVSGGHACVTGNLPLIKSH